MDIVAHPQTVFVTAQIDLAGGRGGILGGVGADRTASGTLNAPHDDVVLWRVIERVAVEKQLVARTLTPAADGLSLAYSYTVKGGGGGLFALDEPGHFQAELVAAFAVPAFLPTVGSVEILSTSVPHDGPDGVLAGLRRSQSFSPAQVEGRLIRLPDDDQSPTWFVEHGVKHILQSPTCGRLRFGDGWQRLIQPLTSFSDAAQIPDGPPLTLAESAEGRLIYSWPAPETYWVQAGRKRRIDDPAPVISRFGDHWRIQLIHLRRAELDLIPEGEPVA